jgi:hypothetical protein
MACKIISESETRGKGREEVGNVRHSKAYYIKEKMHLTFFVQDKGILLIVRWERYGMRLGPMNKLSILYDLV